MPPEQPITLNATIAIPAGRTQQFEWQFSPPLPTGATSAPFSINNSAGTGATQYARTDTFNFPPGTYTVTLKIVPPPYECAEVSITVVAQCEGNCPTVTPSVNIPPCDAAGMRPPVDLQLTFAPPLPPGATYNVFWSPGNGPAATASGTVSPGAPLATLAHGFSYAPGTYFPTASRGR